jgi:hypothetical protein
MFVSRGLFGPEPKLKTENAKKKMWRFLCVTQKKAMKIDVRLLALVYLFFL